MGGRLIKKRRDREGGSWREDRERAVARKRNEEMRNKKGRKKTREKDENGGKK